MSTTIRYTSNTFFVTILLFVTICSLFPIKGSEKTKSVPQTSRSKVLAVQNQYTLAGNHWSLEMTNYGPYGQDIVNRLPFAGGAGGEFPKGSGIYQLFAAGMQVGALVNGVPKVSVIDFDSEFQPGPLQKIDPYSKTEIPVPSNPEDPTNKLFALYANGADGTPLGANGDAIDDYTQWPKQFGAPQKADGSPLIVGNLMSWTVYNDMDSSRHHIPDDSQKDPLGIEVQQISIQMMKQSQSDIYYLYWKIINKGTTDLTNVYVSGWFDADLDKLGNDLVATDTLSSMVFTYNADNSDPVTAGGGAFGAKFFQGPVIAGLPTDTATFFELTQDGFIQCVVPGKKLTGLSATVRYINVRGPEGDPDNDAELYNLMQGKYKNGDPKPGKFTYPADPITAPANQLDPRPDDKRMMLCTGPFNLAVGDTQVVILAGIGATGTDRLDAIKNLRTTAQAVNNKNKNLFLTPHASMAVDHPTATLTEVTVRADLNEFMDVSSCEVEFTPDSAGQTPVTLTLFDDGTPHDGAVNDKVWGNSIVISNRKFPHTGNIIINKEKPSKEIFGEYFTAARLRPVPELTDWSVVWENGKQDKKINHNEKVHVGFWLNNSDSVNSITQCKVYGEYFSTETFFTEIQPWGGFNHDSLRLILVGSAAGDSLGFWYTIRFDGNEAMVYRKFPMTSWDPGSVWRDTLFVTSIRGPAYLLQPIIADPAQTTGHLYDITFFENTMDHTIRWRLRDSTTHTLKLDNALTTVPGYYPHPIIDGIEFQFHTPLPNFADFLETANAGGQHPPTYAAFTFNASGFPNTSLPMQNRPTPNVGGASWGIHTGNTGTSFNYDFFVSRVTRAGGNWRQIVPYDFEIRFTATGSKANLAYTTGNIIDAPFELWNVGIGTPDDASDDFKLIPLLFDMNGNGVFDLDSVDHSLSASDNDPETDWIYLYNPVNKSPGTVGYDAWVASNFNDNQIGDEVMARIVLVNYNSGSIADPTFPANINQKVPETGSVFRIVSVKTNIPGDRLIVHSVPLSVSMNAAPLNYALYQNYPNPFNPVTTITYQLPSKGNVSLKVYDLLGREVRTLVRAIEEPGVKSVLWDSRDNRGSHVATGVYFYRLEVSSGLTATYRTVGVNKMVLIK